MKYYIQKNLVSVVSTVTLLTEDNANNTYNAAETPHKLRQLSYRFELFSEPGLNRT